MDLSAFTIIEIMTIQYTTESQSKYCNRKDYIQVSRKISSPWVHPYPNLNKLVPIIGGATIQSKEIKNMIENIKTPLSPFFLGLTRNTHGNSKDASGISPCQFPYCLDLGVLGYPLA